MQRIAKKAGAVFLSWVAEEMFFNLMGTRELMPEVLKAFIPIIGATAATLAVLGTLSLLRDWDKRQAVKVVSELEELAASGRSVFTGIENGGLPQKHYYRFIVMAGKYGDWPLKIKEPHSGAEIRGAIDRAVYYAQVFRTYGYLRGICRVYRDRWRSAKTHRAKK